MSETRILSIIQTRREFIINIVCECPGLPDRFFDFMAYDDGHDCDSHISGHGRTKTEAMEAFLDAVEAL
jgi:hypothetical protein